MRTSTARVVVAIWCEREGRRARHLGEPGAIGAMTGSAAALCRITRRDHSRLSRSGAVRIRENEAPARARTP